MPNDEAMVERQVRAVVERSNQVLRKVRPTTSPQVEQIMRRTERVLGLTDRSR